MVYTKAVQGKLDAQGMAQIFTGYLQEVFPDAIVLRHHENDGTVRYSSHHVENICSIAEVDITAEDLQEDPKPEEQEENSPLVPQPDASSSPQDEPGS